MPGGAGSGKRLGTGLAVAALVLVSGCGERGREVGEPVRSADGVRAQVFVTPPAGADSLALYRVRVTSGPPFESGQARTAEVWRSRGLEPVALEWLGRDSLLVAIGREPDSARTWRARVSNRLLVHVRTVVR